MLRPDDIAPGQYLRTVNECLGRPARTLAQVNTVGCFRSGEFVFTVRWLNIRPGTQVRPISDRSLNLWEADLAHLEAVEDGDTTTDIPASPPPRQSKPTLRLSGYRRRLTGKKAGPNQLSLFTLDDV